MEKNGEIDMNERNPVLNLFVTVDELTRSKTNLNTLNGN